MKRLITLVLLLALMLCLIPGADAASIYFFAVNDTIPVKLADSTMPISFGGVLYVPHSIFSEAKSLNITPIYSSTEPALILLSSSDKQLKFYTNLGTMVDADNVSNEVKVIIQNNNVYVPLSTVASYFGYSCSYLTSSGGWPVVRLTNGGQIYDDAFFIEQAENLITTRANQYFDAPVSTAPVLTPSTAVHTSTPEPSATSSPEPEDEPEPEPVLQTLYLAFSGKQDSLYDIADLLDDKGLPAVFFLNSDQLSSSGDLLRRLTGTGYGFGLLESADDLLIDRLKESNEIVSTLTKTKTRLVLAQDANYLTVRTLKTEGYIVCAGAYEINQDYDFGQSDSPKLLWLDCDSLTARQIEQILDDLLSLGHSFHLLNELSSGLLR